MVSVQDTTNRLFLLINIRRGLPRTRHVNDNYATPTPPPPPHEETTTTSRGTSHINCNLQAHWYTTPHHLIGVTLNCRVLAIKDFLNTPHFHLQLLHHHPPSLLLAVIKAALTMTRTTQSALLE